MRAQRHDAKGRSTGTRLLGHAKRWQMPTPFIGKPVEMLQSPAYRSLSVPARKALDFLEIEHCLHGGADNGRLVAPHRHLQAFGVSKRDTASALDELEAFGLIRIRERGERQGGRTKTSRFSLTWYPAHPLGETEPTDDWRRVTPEDVADYRVAKREAEALRKSRRKVALRVVK